MRNAVPEMDESCDDGNRTSSDGCSASCNLESAVLMGSDSTTVVGESLPPGGSFTFELVLTSTSYVQVETFADAAAQTCPSIDTRIAVFRGAEELGADDDDGGGGIPRFDLVVNAIEANLGGNGIREDGEQCEDGNTTSGDGCSSGCRPETVITAVRGITRTLAQRTIPLGGADPILISTTATVAMVAETFSDAANRTCTIDNAMELHRDGQRVIYDAGVFGSSRCANFGQIPIPVFPGEYVLETRDRFDDDAIGYELVVEFPAGRVR